MEYSPDNQVEFRAARSEQDLRQILDLQAENLTASLSAAEARDQGFVTVHHDLPLLTMMNQLQPHVIGVSGGRVVAYALSMLRHFGEHIPALKPLCAMLDEQEYEGRRLVDYRYFIMGQVCVAKPFRGQGVFEALYAKMRELYADRYDLLVTEIAGHNTRSAHAHEKVGFERLHRYSHAPDQHWDIVVWPWLDTETPTQPGD